MWVYGTKAEYALVPVPDRLNVSVVHRYIPMDNTSNGHTKWRYPQKNSVYKHFLLWKILNVYLLQAMTPKQVLSCRFLFLQHPVPGWFNPRSGRFNAQLLKLRHMHQSTYSYVLWLQSCDVDWRFLVYLRTCSMYASTQLKIGFWGFRTPGTRIWGSQTLETSFSKKAYLGIPTSCGFLRTNSSPSTTPRSSAPPTNLICNLTNHRGLICLIMNWDSHTNTKLSPRRLITPKKKHRQYIV